MSDIGGEKKKLKSNITGIDYSVQVEHINVHMMLSFWLHWSQRFIDLETTGSVSAPGRTVFIRCTPE